MADEVYPLVFGRSHQLSLNKFFDPSAPSMRKVDKLYYIIIERPLEIAGFPIKYSHH